MAFTINAAVPTVAGVSPTSAAAGGVAFTLTVTGANFVSGATVEWGSAALTTTYVSSTELTASVSAGDIATAGTVNITVTDAGGTSTSVVPFTIAPPLPSIISLSPFIAEPGGSDFTLTINGTNFDSSAVVNWGSTKTLTPTQTNITSTQITVTVPAAQIVTAGTVDVTVTEDDGTSNSETFTIATFISGKVLSGPATASPIVPISASVQLYAAGTTGYGSAPTPIGSSVLSDSTTGAFPAIIFDCSTLTTPGGDQFYLVATGTSNTDAVLMTALGSCANIATSFPSGVTINEATTVASAFALAEFASVDSTTKGIDIGAPTGGSSCNANAGWKSTGDSTCNYIGLKNAFATVRNLVDIPSGQVLAVTPAYCTTTPCTTAAATTPYYATSIVPQGSINAMANALAACVGTQSSCGTLFTATTITTASQIVNVASGTIIDPANTLQAALNIAHCPGDVSVTTCGVDVQSRSGIYSLVAATPPYTPTLNLTTSGYTTDLSLALIYQGGGLGGPPGVVGTPEATGLAIDANGNVWVPTLSSTGGSLVVLNNQGAPITPSGSGTSTAATSYGGYTGSGINNPVSIALDQKGNAWLGNYPASNAHGTSADGTVSPVQLSGTTLSTLTVNGTALNVLTDASGGLLTPAPYGLAIDAGGDVWISSNPGGTGNIACGGGAYGGSILEFDPGTGSVLNAGTTDGYLNGLGCPNAIAFDQNGNLWTFDNGNNGGADNNWGLLQLDSLGNVVGAGTSNGSNWALQQSGSGYAQYLTYLTSGGYCSGYDGPAPAWNIAIDGGSNSWLIGKGYPTCMLMIPNMVNATADELQNGTWGAALETGTRIIQPQSAITIDGEGNAWVVVQGQLQGYGSTNATMDYTNSNASTVMVSPTYGYAAGDPSVNASGRATVATGGTYPLEGGYELDGSGLSALPASSEGGFISLDVDGSGNLWVSGMASQYPHYTGSQLTEFIGLIAPAQKPLSSALTNSAAGTKGLGARP
jgi:hypothetical protein